MCKCTAIPYLTVEPTVYSRDCLIDKFITSVKEFYSDYCYKKILRHSYVNISNDYDYSKEMLFQSKVNIITSDDLKFIDINKNKDIETISDIIPYFVYNCSNIKLYLSIIPDINDELLIIYFLSKLPICLRPNFGIENTSNNTIANNTDSYNIDSYSIEWNDIDCSIFRYLMFIKKLNSLNNINNQILILIGSIMDYILNLVDHNKWNIFSATTILDHLIHLTVNNNNNHNIIINDIDASCLYLNYFMKLYHLECKHNINPKNLSNHLSQQLIQPVQPTDNILVNSIIGIEYIALIKNVDKLNQCFVTNDQI